MTTNPGQARLGGPTGLLADRRQLTAVGLAALACVLFVIAIGLLGPIHLEPGSFSGVIGATIGVLIGGIIRAGSRKEPNGFAIAIARAAAFIGVNLATVAAGLALGPVIGRTEPGLGFAVGVVAMIVLVVASLIWTRSRRDQLRLLAAFAGLAAYFLIAVTVIDGNQPDAGFVGFRSAVAAITFGFIAIGLWMRSMSAPA